MFLFEKRKKKFLDLFIYDNIDPYLFSSIKSIKLIKLYMKCIHSWEGGIENKKKGDNNILGV